jgi:hypothetical protein
MKKYHRQIQNGALVLSLALLSSGCVFLHSAQVSDVDSEVVLQGQRFEILVSELGINLEEGAQLAEGVARAAGSRTDVISTVNDIIALFQMGPKTGNPVFNDDFSDDIIHQIKLKCPSGRISGLTSVRETAKYPVVSGEIVKLIGYCL